MTDWNRHTARLNYGRKWYGGPSAQSSSLAGCRGPLRRVGGMAPGHSLLGMIAIPSIEQPPTSAPISGSCCTTS
eukprot:2032539-Amphidinium_carterae.2